MTLEDVTSGRAVDTVQVGPLDSNIPYGDHAGLTPAYSRDFIAAAVPGTPAWWVRRLTAKLEERAPTLKKWDDYYEGEQPLAFASERFREAFGGRFRAFSSNFCSLVVDGTRERMEVTGFDFGGKRRSERAWRLWQSNDMDGVSQSAHTEALIKSLSYVLVEPSRDGPIITAEDALDAITESDPRLPRRRIAGLKRYVDETGRLCVFLYLPEFVWKLRSADKWSDGNDYTLEPFPSDGEDWPVRNTLGVVPLVPLVNRPRLHAPPKSEIAPVLSNQDAINKYRADALVAAEFAAFRQRWATGLDIPEDPATGKPIEPFKSAVDRLWVVPPPDPEDPNPPETKFGEFAQTDLAPYQAMIESEVGAMSSISRMPYHYLLGQPSAVPPSGESLKSSEAGLISKVKTQLIYFGTAWEEAMRLALIADGDSGGDRTASTEWRDPETRNEGVRTDATVKAFQSGIIDRDEARAAIGYAPGGLPQDQSNPAPAEDGEDGTLTSVEG